MHGLPIYPHMEILSEYGNLAEAPCEEVEATWASQKAQGVQKLSAELAAALGAYFSLRGLCS